MTVCSCHVTYAYQSESTLYSCLDVKELLAWNRRKIWSLGDCNWTRTQNRLVCKQTLKLAKWLSCVLSNYLHELCSVFLSPCATASSKEFLDIQATIEWRFTLKRVRDMTRTYSQMHHADKYSEHSSIIWPVWPNGWVFIYHLSGSEFKSNCSHSKTLFVCQNAINANQMVKYEGQPNFYPFKRHFNKCYWERLSLKFFMICNIKSLKIISAQIVTLHGKTFSEIIFQWFCN